MLDLVSIGSVAIPTAVFTAGVAWGAVKQSLNGTRATAHETKALVQALSHEQGNIQQRVASLEAKTDIVLAAVQKAALRQSLRD